MLVLKRELFWEVNAIAILAQLAISSCAVDQWFNECIFIFNLVNCAYYNASILDLTPHSYLSSFCYYCSRENTKWDSSTAVD